MIRFVLLMLLIGCGSDGGSNRTASDDFTITVEPGGSVTITSSDGEVTIVDGSGVTDITDTEVTTSPGSVGIVGDGNQATINEPGDSADVLSEQLDEDRKATCINCCGNDEDGVADDECLEINNCLPEDLLDTSCTLI